MENTEIQNPVDFRRWLQSELMKRCRKNPRYSLRSFALLLNMDASSVSQIIAGKRVASKKVITHICERLSAAPDLQESFLNAVIKVKKESTSRALTPEQEFVLMTEDAAAYLSNWYYGAILEFTYVESFQNNPSWIAQKLSVTTTEVKIAIERLKRLGLLTENEGVLTKTNQFITNFAPGHTSAALKELQRQILTKALDSIDNTPSNEKDITSMTMAIDIDKLPEARKMITKFRRELCAFLEDGEQTRVYNLGLQLYPVSNNKES